MKKTPPAPTPQAPRAPEPTITPEPTPDPPVIIASVLTIPRHTAKRLVELLDLSHRVILNGPRPTDDSKIMAIVRETADWADAVRGE